MAGKGKPFQPGQPKPAGSGRKPGTPNRATQQLREILEAEGLDPAKKLAQLLPSLEPEKQADVCLALLKYLYPTRLQATVANPDGSDLFQAKPMTKEDMLQLLQAARGEK